MNLSLTVRKRTTIFPTNLLADGLPSTGNPNQPFHSLPAARNPTSLSHTFLEPPFVASRFPPASWRGAEYTPPMSTARQSTCDHAKGRQTVVLSRLSALAQATWSRLRILSESSSWPNCSRALCRRAVSQTISRKCIGRFIILPTNT